MYDRINQSKKKERSFLGRLQEASEYPGFFQGKLLISMPFIRHSSLAQEVIFVCVHDNYGGLGLSLNKLLPHFNIQDLLCQNDILNWLKKENIPIHYGGPFETNKGIVLHSNDYGTSSTVSINDQLSLTTTFNVLQDISQEKGPQNFLLILGHYEWEQGQLESEIQENFWIISDINLDIIFDSAVNQTWRKAMKLVGIAPEDLTLGYGHA